MKDISLEQSLQLLDSIPQPMLLLENSGRIRGFNHAFRMLIGMQGGTAEDFSADPGPLQTLLGTNTVINWIMPDGNECWLAVEVVEITGMPDTQARFYTDISDKLRLRHERDALQQELAEQRLYDQQLHSLLSRRGILISLAPLVARSRRYNSPLSIITLSISTVEDAMASAREDMTALLRDQTRWADLVGSNDNASFILVLQETTRDAAVELVEKLARHVERINADDTPALTVCYGITECQKHDDPDSLLERAEQALTEAAGNASGRAIAL